MATSPDRETHAVSCLVDQVGTFFGGDTRSAIRCLADAIGVIAAASSDEAAASLDEWRAASQDLAGEVIAKLAGRPRSLAVAGMARAMSALCVPPASGKEGDGEYVDARSG